MYNELNELQRLAVDTYFGKVSEYANVNEANDVIRKAILDGIPAIPKRKSELRRYLMQHGNHIFALIEKTVSPVVNRITIEKFGDLINVDSVDLGDKPTYRVKNKRLFKVSQKATGVRTVRRQRMNDDKVETERFALGVKIYEEAFDFLTGAIDWTELCDRVAESFANKTAGLATAVIFTGYDKTNNPTYCMEANANAIAPVLQELIDKVKFSCGVNCRILGTSGALAKVPTTGGVYNVNDGEDKRNFGYVRMFNGTPCVELPQYFDEDLNSFEIPTDLLLVVPDDGTKLCEVCYEGDVSILNDADTMSRLDGQIEMDMEHQCHIGAPIAAYFGMFKIL